MQKNHYELKHLFAPSQFMSCVFIRIPREISASLLIKSISDYMTMGQFPHRFGLPQATWPQGFDVSGEVLGQNSGGGSAFPEYERLQEKRFTIKFW